MGRHVVQLSGTVFALHGGGLEFDPQCHQSKKLTDQLSYPRAVLLLSAPILLALGNHSCTLYLCHLSVFYVSTRVHNVTFCDWSFSHSIKFLKYACCSMWQYFIVTILLSNNSFAFIGFLIFTHSSAVRFLSFHFLAIMSNILSFLFGVVFFKEISLLAQ